MYNNYTFIIEKRKYSYGAYVAEIPNCVAVGLTREEAEENLKEALEFKLKNLPLSNNKN